MTSTSHTAWVEEQDSVRVETSYHEFDVAYREEGTGDPVPPSIPRLPTPW